VIKLTDQLALFNAAKNDEDYWVRVCAVERLTNPARVAEIAEIAEKNGDSGVWRAAWNTLQKLKTELVRKKKAL
jgi:hypothetical protein